MGRVVVDPSFRSTPWAAEKSKAGSDDGIVHVLLVSESNVCRSVLAQSMLQQQLQQEGLADLVHVESRVSLACCGSQAGWMPCTALMNCNSSSCSGSVQG